MGCMRPRYRHLFRPTGSAGHPKGIGYRQVGYRVLLIDGLSKDLGLLKLCKRYLRLRRVQI